MSHFLTELPRPAEFAEIGAKNGRCAQKGSCPVVAPYPRLKSRRLKGRPAAAKKSEGKEFASDQRAFGARETEE
jgi:hypothetical protein